MAQPKKHHYLPQWLSGRWISSVEDGQVFGISKLREGAVSHGFRATPKAIGWKRNLYSVAKEDGTNDARLESDFYSKLDDFLNETTNEIILALENKTIPEMNDETRKILAHCLVIDSGRRNPDQTDIIITSAQHPEFKASIMSRVPKRFTQQDASSMYERLVGDPKYMKEITNRSRRFFLSKGANSLTTVPFRYLITPPGKTFILGNPLVEKRQTYIAPISPFVAIAFRSAGGPLCRRIDERELRGINEDIFRRASLVVSTSEHLLKSLARKAAGAPLTFTSDTDRLDR